MPARKLLGAFLVLWMATGVFLFVGGAATAREALWARHPNPHLVFLGGIEAVAALLFLIPRTFRAGAVGLLITVSIALIVHVALGEFRGDLLFYDATVFFAFVHGPLTAPQWRTLVSPPAV